MNRENNIVQQIASFVAAVLISGALIIAVFGTPVRF